jgi:hypothetical protein
MRVESESERITRTAVLPVFSIVAEIEVFETLRSESENTCARTHQSLEV